MTIKTGAALSINVNIGDRCRITVKDAQDLVEVESELSQAQFKNLHKQFCRDLKGFCTALAELKQSNISRVIDLLLQLQTSGRAILWKLFQGEPNKLAKTVQMCNRACPNWSRQGSSPALISVRTPISLGVPVEMLPLLELTTPKGDLARIAESFLSFSAIVKRNIGMPPPDSDRLLATPRLPVKAFIYRGLPGVEQVSNFLQDNNLIDFDGAWPDAGAPTDPDNFAAALARHLWEPETSFNGGVRLPPDQICFFACHCDTTAEFPGDHTLTLHTGKGWLWGERKVKLSTLTDKLLNLRIEQSDKLLNLRIEQSKACARPLLFLNACGSAVVDPAGAGSFPDLFLMNDLGFRGFIGTQSTIPDAFAAAFAQAFYEYLLEGRDIGRALHASRWKLLYENHNPLGILYSLYAEPEICVRRIETPFDAKAHPG